MTRRGAGIVDHPALPTAGAGRTMTACRSHSLSTNGSPPSTSSGPSRSWPTCPTTTSCGWPTGGARHRPHPPAAHHRDGHLRRGDRARHRRRPGRHRHRRPPARPPDRRLAAAGPPDHARGRHRCAPARCCSAGAGLLDGPRRHLALVRRRELDAARRATHRGAGGRAGQDHHRRRRVGRHRHGAHAPRPRSTVADIAQTVQLAIEYDPQPPFDAGSPSKAPAGDRRAGAVAPVDELIPPSRAPPPNLTARDAFRP